MKIQNISIKNYKAFYGEYDFDVAVQNLLVYGQNGSGKSSLYYALKDFFQSSMETINMNAVENILLQEDEKGKGYIKVTFDNNTTEELSHTTTPTSNAIKEANLLKSFLTYKHLLGVHYVEVNDDINLFNLLVNGVLKHYNNEDVTGNKELGELWQDVVNAYQKPQNQANDKKIITANESISQAVPQKITTPTIKERESILPTPIVAVEIPPEENPTKTTDLQTIAPPKKIINLEQPSPESLSLLEEEVATSSTEKTKRKGIKLRLFPKLKDISAKTVKQALLPEAMTNSNELALGER